MTMDQFRLLKKLMTRGASTDSDAEALQCFRRASAIVAGCGHTWETALSRCIIVIDGFGDVEGAT